MTDERIFNAIIVGINTLVTILAFVLFAIIGLYLTKKPTGMQTPFDQMVKDLLVSSYLCSILSKAMEIEWGKNSLFSQYPKSALVYFYLMLIVGHAMFIQIFFTVSLRYLYIFHSTWVNEVDDGTIKTMSRGINFFASVILATFEMTVHDYSQGRIFMKMTKVPNENVKNLPASTVKTLVVLAMAMVLYMQFRIEVAKRRSKERIPDLGYSVWTLRSMALLLTICCAMTILWLVDVISIRETKSENRLIIHSMITMIMYNLFPAIMIIRNRAMSSWALKYFHLN